MAAGQTVSNAGAQGSPLGFTPIGDYVPCRFTSEEERRFRREEEEPQLQAVKQAIVDKAVDLSQDKKLKKPLDVFSQKVRNATSISQIDKAMQADALHSVQPQLQEAAAAAKQVSSTPQGRLPPEDVSCSQSILSYRETSDGLGKRIARTYIVIQVVVRNLNADNEFLLHDVQVAVPASHFFAGRDKLLARGVAVKGQSLDPRNFTMRGLDALSGTLGAISVAFTSVDFKNGVGIFTAFLPGLKQWFPDYTIDQMNRLSDMGFSASSAYKIVVPKNGSVPFVTFIPQELFFKNLKDWSRAEFLDVQNGLSVVVAGVHIQEVQKDTASLTEMQCAKDADGNLDLSKSENGNFSCSLKGGNLNFVQKIRFKNAVDSTDRTSADGDVKVTNQNSTEATATFKQPDLQQLSAPSYAAYLELAKGDEQHTGITVSFANPKVTTVSTAIDTKSCSGGVCPLAVGGIHLDKLNKLGLATKDNDSSSSIQCNFKASDQNSGSCDLSASSLKSGTYFVVMITKDGSNLVTHLKTDIK
jgi:hypothetical protein